MESNRHCDRFNRPIYRRYTMHSKGKSEVKAYLNSAAKKVRDNYKIDSKMVV